MNSVNKADKHYGYYTAYTYKLFVFVF